MLGRVRPSSSSLESLELERPSPKIIKDDSLSIYEATLLKLKEGGQRDIVSSSLEQEMKIDEMGGDFATNSPYEEAMETENSNSSPSNTTLSPSSSDCQPGGSAKVEPKKMHTSVSDLFAKYKLSHSALSSPD